MERVSVALRFKRWRALRGVPVLTADSSEGAVVRATGVARAGTHDEPFVPPLAGVRCVTAWTKFEIPNTQNPRRTLPSVERLLIRPFVLETDELDVIVDASHVQLLFPIRREGNASEISIADGATITVIGTLLLDGVERPQEDELAFRDAFAVCKLVGNKQHPVVITASVSDTDAG